MSLHQNSFGSILRGLRGRERIKQGELARQLSLHRNTVGAWERGDYLPDLTTVHEIVRILRLNERDANSLFATHSTKNPQVMPWNLPFLRNLFFTGRAQLLQSLHEALQGTKDRSASALCGLGGVGKTQTALEYAYRFQSSYRSIFWVQAETAETRSGSYLAIADLLDLPEKSEYDQNQVLKAVTRWLQTHTDWLLIYDNVENVEELTRLLPPGPSGAILLTTRVQATGSFFQCFEIEEMSLEDATLFLLRRARLLQDARSLEREQAARIAIQLGRLPLALDQAGAYIEEHGCPLGEYLTLYHTSRQHFLQERGSFSTDHPHSVAATFLLAFEQVQRLNPGAAEILRFAAFLAPDGLPEELLLQGAGEAESFLPFLPIGKFTFNTIVRDLLRFSLIQRNPGTRTISLHRLIQEVLRDEMDQETRRLWVERAIHRVNQLFPTLEANSRVEEWPSCERLLPHVQVCTTWSEQGYGLLPETAQLFLKTANYLRERGLYPEAIVLTQKALAIRMEVLGVEHLETAACLNDLGVLYRKQGKYAEAEYLYQQALEIRQRELGLTHDLVSESLQNIAIVAWYQSDYKKAELLLQRALVMNEQIWGPTHEYTGGTMSQLAMVYSIQGRYTEAELLYRQTLDIHEQTLGPLHLSTAISLSRLASLYQELGKYAEAEPLFRRALDIRKQLVGSEHILIAYSLGNIAALSLDLGRYEEAEHLLQQALMLHERTLGSSHPDISFYLLTLANLLHRQGKYEQALSSCQRALVATERAFGLQHARSADGFNLLGVLYRDLDQFAQAESLLQRALGIYQRALPPSNPRSATSLNALGVLYRRQSRYQEAEIFLQRALDIRKERFGCAHPQTAESLHDLAQLYRDQDLLAKEEVLSRHALSIARQTLGSEHPLTQQILRDMPLLLEEK